MTSPTERREACYASTVHDMERLSKFVLPCSIRPLLLECRKTGPLHTDCAGRHESIAPGQGRPPAC